MIGRGAYYNEIDPFAAAWLRELITNGQIALGEVDERSIAAVQPADLRGFTQCHFFAGIGGWSYALRLAGWPDDRPVWTGSCPCQAHSSAAHGQHTAIDWYPQFYRLLEACRPRTVFGEQVAAQRRWLDRVCDDLESVGYAIGAAVLPAFSVGHDHARYRIWFVGDTDSHGEPRRPVYAETSGLSGAGSESHGVVPPYGVSRDVALLRGFGNAIVPQVAQAFIESYLDTQAESGVPCV